MNAAESTCPACHKVFTHTGLSQHLAKTRRSGCRAVYAAFQPQSSFGSSPYAQTLLTSTANSISAGYPGWSFGSKHPSGHDGISPDSLAFSPLGIESTMTVNMDDRKVAFHRFMPYTKPATAMDVGDVGNGADANDRAVDEADNSVDGDGTSDTADTTDANVLEILTQIQTNDVLDLESTAPNPEHIPSAESESPPENLANPVEPSSADTHPEEVVEHFAHGKPGAPINDLQGSSIYESSQEGLGEDVWTPFQSEIEWDFAHWAKSNRLSSSALADLLAIPDVRLFFFLLYSVAKCS